MKALQLVKELQLYLGIPNSSTPKDMVSSSLTALVSTLCVIFISQQLLILIEVPQDISHNIYILTSIAATSVLVFSVPHGALSQPWPVIGGHFFSAFVGVICWQAFSDNLMLASALAVSGAILFMAFFRCIHPPGGATALGAVLGGDAIHALEFSYLLTPTLLNCLLVVVLATLINLPLNWRRYPAHLYFKMRPPHLEVSNTIKNELTFNDFLAAINEHESMIDITEEGWEEIYESAIEFALQKSKPTTR